MEGENAESSHQVQDANDKDAAGAGEESWEQSTSAAMGMAKDAAAMFQARRFQDCLALLQQLLAKKEDDPKVLHNIALAEYYCDGCTDSQKLLDVLAKVKGRSDELARTADEQLEGFGISASSPQSTNAASSSRASTGTVAPSSGPSSDTVVYMEDYDTSIPMLNTVLILYHSQQYASALSVLEPLYRNIEPIEETAALRVCLLMMDITLASRQPARAARVLHYMEKAFGFGYLLAPGDGAGTAPQSSTQTVSAGLGLSEGRSIQGGGHTATIASSLMSTSNGEMSLTQNSSEDVFDEEPLNISLDMEGSNAVRSSTPLSLSSSMIRTPIEKTSPAPASDIKLLLHLYKVRLLLLTRNYKATKREIKSALNLARDNLTALLLKAQLEYSKGNYRKAIKLLTTCNSRAEPEPGMTAMFLINLGCIHHRLGKIHTAGLYFLKALHNSVLIKKERPLKPSTFSHDRSLSILYNCGMMQLLCGNPTLAASCFQEAGCLFYNRPLFWLRLAECCILALEKGLLDGPSGDVTPKRKDIAVSVVGEGKWRKIVLPSGSLNPVVDTSLQNLKIDDVESKSDSTLSETLGPEESAWKPEFSNKLSMVFARHCLRNAIYLLDRLDAKAAEAAEAAAAAEEIKEGDDTNNAAGSSISVHQKESKNGETGVAGTTQISSNAGGKEAKGAGVIATSVSAFEDELRKEQFAVRQCVLADWAFVELCLENPLKALQIAETLLRLNGISSSYSFLGHMYAAEALCLLDRPREAADHLSTCLAESSSIGTEASHSEEDGQKWKNGENSEASGGEDGTASVASNPTTGRTLPEPSSIVKFTGAHARASLYINLAAIYVIQGEITQAQHWATQAFSVSPENPLAILALVYVELSQGRNQEAVALIKLCRHLSVTRPQTIL
ncbi:hypothetical protein O6H91_13G064500 [Diphasiastrum complanatum]|uniref:Uncharacterized protein n=1 Tax=Diphasiastrum complanatum TaxID=34168 RepID=A0ACC2BVP3_DIPCM|nr:hypothetical protein O6H91_13G064500 [Diphasiastrum complanatum]